MAAFLRRWGSSPEAVADFDKAIAVCTRLEELGSTNAADALAMNLTNRGYVLRELGKFREAFADHDRAVVILTRLVKEDGRLKLERELAISLGNRGNALGDLGELTRSFEDYDRAAEIVKRLIEEEGQTDLVDVLAMLRRSRVEILEWQGREDRGPLCFKEQRRSLALTEMSRNPAAAVASYRPLCRRRGC